jgi:hypothetical protein
MDQPKGGRLHFQNPDIRAHGNAIHAFECVLEMGLRYMEPSGKLRNGYLPV